MMTLEHRADGVVLGSELEVGDSIVFLGRVHRIAAIRPYSHPLITREEPGWRIVAPADRFQVVVP
jgi:hypothetical protein